MSQKLNESFSTNSKIPSNLPNFGKGNCPNNHHHTGANSNNGKEVRPSTVAAKEPSIGSLNNQIALIYSEMFAAKAERKSTSEVLASLTQRIEQIDQKLINISTQEKSTYDLLEQSVIAKEQSVLALDISAKIEYSQKLIVSGIKSVLEKVTASNKAILEKVAATNIKPITTKLPLIENILNPKYLCLANLVIMLLLLFYLIFIK